MRGGVWRSPLRPGERLDLRLGFGGIRPEGSAVNDRFGEESAEIAEVLPIEVRCIDVEPGSVVGNEERGQVCRVRVLAVGG